MNESRMGEIADLIHPDVTAYITNATGGTTEVHGLDELLTHFPDFNAMADSFHGSITQTHEIDQDTVMFMVEIVAARKGLNLHNFAGIYLKLQDGQMLEYRMVEALPEFSDRFWSA